jgi:hypothetical protein
MQEDFNAKTQGLEGARSRNEPGSWTDAHPQQTALANPVLYKTLKEECQAEESTAKYAKYAKKQRKMWIVQPKVFEICVSRGLLLISAQNHQFLPCQTRPLGTGSQDRQKSRNRRKLPAAGQSQKFPQKARHSYFVQSVLGKPLLFVLGSKGDLERITCGNRAALRMHHYEK